jgi:hypothetical protein
MSTLAGRLALVVDELGPEEAARLSEKSWKQLMRYCAGAEPPFGVIRAFVEATGATFDWLAFGKVSSEADQKLTWRGLNGELVRLEAERQTDLSAQDRSDVEELLSLTRQRINAIEAADRPSGSAEPEKVAQTGLETSRLERAIALIEQVLDEDGLELAPAAKAQAAAAAYSLLVPGADETSIKTLLRLVKG